MEIEKYHELLNNNSVLKFQECNCRYFRNKENGIVIFFLFMHKGFPNQLFTSSEKRILLSVCSQEKFKIDIPIPEVGKETIIMVNKDLPDFAMSFLLTIDKINRKVSVHINDYPRLGQGIITTGEKNGIYYDF